MAIGFWRMGQKRLRPIPEPEMHQAGCAIDEADGILRPPCAELEPDRQGTRMIVGVLKRLARSQQVERRIAQAQWNIIQEVSNVEARIRKRCFDEQSAGFAIGML